MQGEGEEPNAVITCGHSVHHSCIYEYARNMKKSWERVICPTCTADREVALLRKFTAAAATRLGRSFDAMQLATEAREARRDQVGQGHGNIMRHLLSESRRTRAASKGHEPPAKTTPKGGASGAAAADDEPTKPANAEDKGKRKHSSRQQRQRRREALAAQPCLVTSPSNQRTHKTKALSLIHI